MTITATSTHPAPTDTQRVVAARAVEPVRIGVAGKYVTEA